MHRLKITLGMLLVSIGVGGAGPTDAVPMSVNLAGWRDPAFSDPNQVTIKIAMENPSRIPDVKWIRPIAGETLGQALERQVRKLRQVNPKIRACFTVQMTCEEQLNRLRDLIHANSPSEVLNSILCQLSPLLDQSSYAVARVHKELMPDFGLEAWSNDEWKLDVHVRTQVPLLTVIAPLVDRAG